MSAAATIPRGTATGSGSPGASHLNSPNISAGNRARSNQFNTRNSRGFSQGRANSSGNPQGLNNIRAQQQQAANQARYRQQNANAQSARMRQMRGRARTGSGAARTNNLRRIQSARTPANTPRPVNVSSPASAAPTLGPAGSAGAASTAGAGASIWTASPAAVPGATAVTAPLAFAGGLGIGNWIYEDVLDRPWGPSLGDYLFPREWPQRDGPAETYDAPGEEELRTGQMPVEYYFAWFYRFQNPDGSIRENWPPPDGEPDWNGFYPKVIGPVAGPKRRPGTVWFDMIGSGDSVWSSIAAIAEGATLIEQRLFFRRTDGLPDIPVPDRGAPRPTTPNEPYRLPSSPQAQPSPSPSPSPSTPAEPTPQLQPQTQPSPSPSTPTTPFPELRPDATDTPFPTPFPPLIPGGPFSPRGTPSPSPDAPTPQTPTPPSTRSRPNCGCAGINISHGAAQAQNVIEAQQKATSGLAGGGLGAAGGGASLAAILAQLLKMQSFAEKAWKTTRLDKLINLLTLISVLHNAGMLSREIGETIGELTSNMLAAVGVKDETDNPLDINELVGSSVKNFVQTIVGEDVYNNTSKAWLKANRIVSAATQIAWTVRSLNDTTKDILEWTAENTGRIGNALRDWGVVGEKAYPAMSERVKAQDAYRLKFQRITDGLENVEDAADSLAQITGNVREIQEEYTELKQQQDNFKELVSTTAAEGIATSAPESVPVAEAAGQAALDSQSPEVAITDAQRGS